MNEDQKLLEMAAKAAAIHPWIHCFGVPPYMGLRLSSGAIWNPLTDDGDALRLAVKLSLDIIHNSPEDKDRWVMAQTLDIVEDVEDESMRLAATRRAIVRAAAEIGRAMP